MNRDKTNRQDQNEHRKINFFEIVSKEYWHHSQMENVSISDRGISLQHKVTYDSQELLLNLNGTPVYPISLGYAPCGPLYGLGKKEQDSETFLFVYDVKGAHLSRIGTVDCRDAVSITAGYLDMYLVFPGKVICLKKEDFRIRWEINIKDFKNIEDDIDKDYGKHIRITSPGRNILYVLDVKKEKVFILYPGSKPAAALKLHLKNEDGSPFDLQRPVDIAADTKHHIYILESGGKIHRFNYKGIAAKNKDEEQVPLKHGSLMITVDDCGGFYIGLNNGTLDRFEKRDRYESQGYCISENIDSRILGCRWFKIKTSSKIPERTSVSLYYLAKDLPEDSKYKPAENDPSWKLLKENIHEMEAQRLDARGEHLWIKIKVQSIDHGKTTPFIDRIRVFSSGRHSYLDYLPAIYRENKSSREFLEKFLTIFQTMMEDIESECDNITALLDPAETPAGFLPWLSTWVGTIYDETWKEDCWRAFLAKAVKLYEKRGTRVGLEEVLEIYIGQKPTIVEHHKIETTEVKNGPVKLLERIEGKSPVGPTAFLRIDKEEGIKVEDIPIFYDTRWKDINCFCVLITENALQGNSLSTIRRIVDEWKPAHTWYGVIVLQPWFYVDPNSHGAIDIIFKKPEFVLEVSSIIGKETILPGREHAAPTLNKTVSSSGESGMNGRSGEKISLYGNDLKVYNLRKKNNRG